MSYIVEIGNCLVSSEIITEYFACDYQACHGCCCIIGDSGAPMEDGEEKDYLIWLITIQMKKVYLLWNKDTVDDSQIYDDLREYSGGRIDIQEKEIKTYRPQYNANAQRNNLKRKKNFKKKY